MATRHHGDARNVGHFLLSVLVIPCAPSVQSLGDPCVVGRIWWLCNPVLTANAPLNSPFSVGSETQQEF